MKIEILDMMRIPFVSICVQARLWQGGDNCLDLAFERGDKPEILVIYPKTNPNYVFLEGGIVVTLPLAHVCL